MNETQSKAREIRDDCHSRLQRMIDRAKREICRIEVLDEILGEDSLEAVPMNPFIQAPEVRRIRTANRLAPAPPAPAAPPSKPKEKRTRGNGPTIVELVHKVLKSYPGRWFNINALISEIKRGGGGTLNRSSVQGELIKLTHKKTPWLDRKKSGRTGLYSFVANQNASRQVDGAPEPTK